MRAYPFLDTPCPELAAGGSAITFYCVCQHRAQLRPADFNRWPTSSLHGVARKLRCTRCDRVGENHRHHRQPGAHRRHPAAVSLNGDSASRQRRRRGKIRTAMAKKKKAELSGRDAKRALMTLALEQAGKGLCAGFKDVLKALESRGIDALPLRLYASADDVDAIDRRCRDVRTIRFPRGKS